MFIETNSSSDTTGKFPELPVWSPLSCSFSTKTTQTASKVEDNNGASPATWRSLFSFTNQHHISTVSAALTLTIIGGLIKPAIAIFVGEFFQDLASYGAGKIDGAELTAKISWWCIGLVILGLVSWLINGSFLSFWIVFGELQARSARERLFNSMLEKAMEWYDLREDGIESLLIRIQTQIRELQTATSQPLGFLFADSITAFAALALAFYTSWKLTLMIMALLPLVAILLALNARNMQPSIEAQKSALSEASKYANTAITCIDTVKSYNGQEQEVWQYARAIRKSAKWYMVQVRASSLQMGLIRFVVTAMFVQGFWFGIYLIRGGSTAGDVLTCFYACLMATQAGESVLPQWLILARGMSAGATLGIIKQQMERGRKVTSMGGSVKPDVCYGDVEISNLSFSYPSNPTQTVLSNVNLFFPAFETTFIIGKSGSGKSTLSNILLKFYKASSGQITIDGNTIETIDQEWLRRNITLVQQQNVLFSESLYQNIAFGSLDHDKVLRAEVKTACQMALLQQTINDLPGGLETILSAKGNDLSGGQKQRIAIARAHLRDTPILILDEATSALDYINRSLVMEAIREWRQGKTTIVITHDISQIEPDDYVYVLDQGKLVQEGYRRKLTLDPLSPFASFLPPLLENQETNVNPSLPVVTTSEERDHFKGISRNSFMSTNTEASEDSFDGTAVPIRFKRLSNFFGVNNEPSTASQMRAVRKSFGLASSYANVLRTEDTWGSAEDQDIRTINSPPTESYSPSTTRPLSVGQSVPISTPYEAQDMPRRASSASRYVSHLSQYPAPEDNGSGERSHGLEIVEMMGQQTRNSRAQFSSALRSPPLPIVTTAPQRPSVSYFDVKSSIKWPTTTMKGLPEFPKRLKKHPAPLRKILGTVWPTLLPKDKVLFIFGFFCAFIHAAATPVFSWVFAKLLNVFYATSGQSEEAKKWSLSILGIAVVDGIATYIQHYLLEYCGEKWVDTLRAEALNRILMQPRSWFEKEKNRPNRINECLDRNAEEMRNLVGRFAGGLFVCFVMMTISIIWSFVVCWKLTLVGLASSPFMYGITRSFEYVSGELEAKTNEASDLAASVFTETFSSIRVVRALTLERYFQTKYGKAIVHSYKIGTSRAIWSGVFFGISDSGSLFITALVFYYGVRLVGRDNWPVESVVAVIALLLFSISNVNAIVAFIPQISTSRATASYMLHLANLPKHGSHEAFGELRLKSPFPIRLNSLNFTYPNRPGVTVLKDIDLEFEAGSCTSIVGSSGSGKSTIASLILNLYAPSPHRQWSIPKQGDQAPLTFGGHSVNDCDTFSLRSFMAIVSQNPTLFPASIADNITYGLPVDSGLRASFSIEEAARQADIHDFIISLPSGYATQIGDGGQSLSGGQSQRIAIARALIRHPQVLILDEATSALDAESAEMIRCTISHLISSSRHDYIKGDGLRMNKTRGMAVIIITHNVEMMRVAERIVMLNQGRVVESGSYEELIKRRGKFAGLMSGGVWLDGRVP